VLTNWDEVMGAGHLEPCMQPALPHAPHGASPDAAPEGMAPPPPRHFTIGKEVWIDREDFCEVPPKGYKRLVPPSIDASGKAIPGSKVRLKGGYVIECTGCNKDAAGTITEVLATVVPDTKSGTPGSETVKVKGVITWVGVADGVNAEVRMYDRLFLDAQPDAGSKDFIENLNPKSLKVITAIVEPSLANAKAGQQFQFERHGYFVADRVDHVQRNKPVFNLAVGLKDSWGK
jgi:glutaminyl-tRNA synthetase